MIKIIILLIVFILFLILIIKNKSNESFTNVQIKCGLEGSLLNQTNGGDSSANASANAGSSADPSQQDGSIPNGVNTQIKLEIVDPEKPECVGICVNQHTYTNDNIKGLTSFLNTTDEIGKIKSNQNDNDIMTSGCGQCINNFYSGLKLISNTGSECQ